MYGGWDVGGASLRSAAALGGELGVLSLDLVHRRVALRERGVDAHAVVDVLLRATRLDGDRQALDDLPGVRPQDVHADDFLPAGDVADDLHVTGLLAALMVQVPFERAGAGVVHLDALLAVLLDGVLLAVA